MTLDEVLETVGISASDAYSFIIDNLDKPQIIYSAAQSANFSLEHLTNLFSRYIESVSIDDVSYYFESAGLDSKALSAAEERHPSESKANYYFNDSGVLVVEPEEPLSENQMLFIGGLIKAKEVSRTFESDNSIASFTTEGYLVNVGFGDQDYPDIIFDITSSTFDSIDAYLKPLMDVVHQKASNSSGVTQEQLMDLYTNFSGTSAQNHALLAYYGALQDQIDPVIKPMYDEVMSLQSDLWF